MGLQITNLYSELDTFVLVHWQLDVPLLQGFVELHTVLKVLGVYVMVAHPSTIYEAPLVRKLQGLHACVVAQLELHSTPLTLALAADQDPSKQQQWDQDDSQGNAGHRSLQGESIMINIQTKDINVVQVVTVPQVREK